MKPQDTIVLEFGGGPPPGKSKCSKTLNSHSKKDQRLFFQDRLSLNAGQKYFRMLQFFRPALGFHISKAFVFPIFEWPLKTGLNVEHKTTRYPNIKAGFD